MSSPSSRRKRKLERLFKEQNGMCYLCGMPMRLKLVGHQCRFDASLDHVIPRRDGGCYSMKNLKAAHKWCNNARGAGEREESFLQHVENIQRILSCPNKLKVLEIQG